MGYPKFSMDELQVTKSLPGMRGRITEIFNTPITPRENMLRMYQGKTPMWIPSPGEWQSLRPIIDPENQARSKTGGIDGYGVEWMWVDVAGGAMVKPGSPICSDINEWEKTVTIPNPDEWDWKGLAEEQKDFFDPDLPHHVGFGSCLFERLMAILDAGNALLALVDEEQQEGVHRFFRAVTDYRKRYYELCKQWFDIDILNWNDDWGTQKAPFFSVSTAREMLLPYFKESMDKIHELGCYGELHCCGMVEPLVPLFIEGGMDSWQGQPLNDKIKLKKMYKDTGFIFSHAIDLPEGTDEAEVKAAVKQYMEDFGYDNRCFNITRTCMQAFNRELYIQSRKNFDKMVEEGTAIL